jgi:hypothetical protein
MTRLERYRRIVDRVHSQARRAHDIAEQLQEAGLMYAPEFRKQGKQVALLAAELDRHLDAIRDPRGSFSRSTLTKGAGQ